MSALLLLRTLWNRLLVLEQRPPIAWWELWVLGHNDKHFISTLQRYRSMNYWSIAVSEFSCVSRCI